MLDNLITYAYATATTIIFATFGLSIAYLFDRIYYQPDNDVSEYLHVPTELPPTEDILNSPDTVPTVTTQQYCLEPSDQCCMLASENSESSSNPVDNIEASTAPGYTRPSFDYRHEFWPSPRPVNFVKALVKADHVQIEGRLTHAKAIELLASRAEMKPDEFLRVDPITYTKFFMPAQYNAAVLLGQSIQRLEDTIRRHQYLDTLRRHG